MHYKLLKDWGAYKEGDEVDGAVLEITPEEVSALIMDGTLDPIIDESLYETITVDEAYLAEHPEEAAGGINVGDEIMRLKEAPELTEDEKKAADEAAAKAEEDAKPKGRGKGKAAAEAEAEAAPKKALVYRGQEVISDDMREVNGKEYHHVRLADGSSTDVPDDEYEAMVNNAQ